MEVIKRLFKYAIKLSLSLSISIFITKHICLLVFPEINNTKKLQKTAKKILEAIGIKNPPELTNDESLILINFISTTNKTTFNDIIGYENVKLTIRRRIMYPLFLSCRNINKLLNPPSGVLFHGPTGNGKTKFTHALRLESGYRFLDIDMSILMNKFVGESQKLITALFSLAKKIEPVILFIDEMESFFRTKYACEYDNMSDFKAHFLLKWDDHIRRNSKIIVIGTSNMAELIDPAVLRRMPVKIFIDFPDETTRINILNDLLSFTSTNSEIINDVKLKTSMLSCANLVEICRLAVSNKINIKLINEFDYYNQIYNHYFFDTEPITDVDLIFAINEFNTFQLLM
uniref:AAA domain-containing protein n=1 Tax=Strongyloides venezuelensis TaxID=75913 RepID=A0A0K0FL29_STRVS